MLFSVIALLAALSNKMLLDVNVEEWKCHVSEEGDTGEEVFFIEFDSSSVKKLVSALSVSLKFEVLVSDFGGKLPVICAFIKKSELQVKKEACCKLDDKINTK